MANKPIRQFAEELSDAYSTDAYGGWYGCIQMLRKRGYNDREIEAIIRSKWTRWARDMNSSYKGSPTILAKYLDSQKNLRQQLDEITQETFAS